MEGKLVLFLEKRKRKIAATLADVDHLRRRWCPKKEKSLLENDDNEEVERLFIGDGRND